MHSWELSFFVLRYTTLPWSIPHRRSLQLTTLRHLRTKSKLPHRDLEVVKKAAASSGIWVAVLQRCRIKLQPPRSRHFLHQWSSSSSLHLLGNSMLIHKQLNKNSNSLKTRTRWIVVLVNLRKWPKFLKQGNLNCKFPKKLLLQQVSKQNSYKQSHSYRRTSVRRRPLRRQLKVRCSSHCLNFLTFSIQNHMVIKQWLSNQLLDSKCCRLCKWRKKAGIKYNHSVICPSARLVLHIVTTMTITIHTRRKRNKASSILAGTTSKSKTNLFSKWPGASLAPKVQTWRES